MEPLKKAVVGGKFAKIYGSEGKLCIRFSLTYLMPVDLN